jgi:hypothetical protein
MYSAFLKAKFRKFIKDPQILSMMVERSIRYNNLDDFFNDIETETAIIFLAEVALKELVTLRPTNLGLQDEWLKFTPPDGIVTI